MKTKETPEEILSPIDWYDKKFPQDTRREFMPIYVKEYAKYFHSEMLKLSLPAEEEINKASPIDFAEWCVKNSHIDVSSMGISELYKKFKEETK